MSAETLTVQVPSDLYDQLRRSARESQRSVEEELLHLVTTAVTRERLPANLEEIVASLSALDDAQLWQAARSRLPADAAEELEALNHRRQRDSLSNRETRRAEELLRLYERFMLVRAQAAALLKERGFDVSGLLAS